MTRPGAAELLRTVGLLADGPVRFGKPLLARRAGVYLIELAAPLPTAPIEMTKVGKWIERVGTLRLDGEVPTAKALATRLASFWLPDATVLYIGATRGPIGPRVNSLVAHVLGDPRPHPDGQWLHTLRDLSTARVWWAGTDAADEYVDAMLEAFGAAGPAPNLGGTGLQRPSDALLLPWGVTRRPTGERQPTGITGSLRPVPTERPSPPRKVVAVAPGDAEGIVVRGAGSVKRPGDPAALARAAAGLPPRAADATRPTPTPRIVGTATKPARATRATAGSRANQAPEPVSMSADALERLRAELDELTRVRRPEVVARIKAAREHGDLKENAEYHAAREEQSFLEGRVQLLEQRLRNAVVVEHHTGAVGALGSRITIEIGGDQLTYTLVGTTEADPKAGRISTASPVGAALLGARVGAEVVVRTPRGEARYTVISVE